MKEYRSPELKEYGRVEDRTAGATGNKPDYVVSNNQLVIDNNNPTCTNNVPYGACVRF
ncbi:hypothetical protein Tter_2828 [Thermobaculum terrenum ATCC BAA-798]|uniref:Uncharacterized protein n=1 Tax=Thermobaculum terrenum (strain ATCC BAA-798 / CCMEE 7001 / YNP1) TaxID=525904 RepID=D1CIZ1_THET1|nr:hypothetical protein [Thermobaculum terrenum]ACZ43711.1 hypothetical protein Tter_2828 [Thermobaculum terrenum ATCC BAA-798]